MKERNERNKKAPPLFFFIKLDLYLTALMLFLLFYSLIQCSDDDRETDEG